MPLASNEIIIIIIIIIFYTPGSIDPPGFKQEANKKQKKQISLEAIGPDLRQWNRKKYIMRIELKRCNNHREALE